MKKEKLELEIEKLAISADFSVDAAKTLYYNVFEKQFKSGGFEEDEMQQKALKKLEVSLRKSQDSRALMGGETEIEVIFLGLNKQRDVYSNVIQEIKNTITNQGIETAEEKGMVLVENGKVIDYLDYRPMFGDNKNEYFGYRISEIPKKNRFKRQGFCIALIGEEPQPAMFYLNGDASEEDIPLFKAIKIMGREFTLNENDPFGRIITYNVRYKPSEKEVDFKQLYSIAKKYAKNFFVPFENIKTWYENQTNNHPGCIMTEGIVFQIVDSGSTENAQVLLMDENANIEPILTYVNRNEIKFGIGSKIFFTGSVFTIARTVGEEEIEQLVMKAWGIHPIDAVNPNAQPLGKPSGETAKEQVEEETQETKKEEKEIKKIESKKDWGI